MICPIMTNGWLSNKYAARTENRTFQINNYPECVEKDCAFWLDDKCGFRLTSHLSGSEKDRSA